MDNLNVHEIGHQAELNACQFLQSHGLHLLAKNFSCNRGEIDLIMKDNEVIVFVEVRTRYHSDFANAVESVDTSKLKKIYRTAVYYLQNMDWFDKVDCRIDVVGIDRKSGQLEWIKNVFER
jgi:putative endonuclease